MKKVIIGFSKSTATINWLSKAIMWVQGTPYSHVYIKAPSAMLGLDIIYQANGSGVHFIGPEMFVSKNIVVAEVVLEVPDETYVNVLRFAIKNAGKKYGYVGMFLMTLVLLGRKLGFKVKNPGGDGFDKFWCSELAADVCLMCGVYLSEDPENIDPKFLYEALIAYQSH